MPTLAELARSHTRLTIDDVAHLQRLAAAWGMLADLCFADLLLLAPVAGEEGHRFVVLAQVRPTTDQTLYRDDMVGTIVDEVERPLIARVWRIGEIGVGDAAVIGQTIERANVQAIPVRHRGKVIALLTREAATTTGRRLGELERVYFEIFDRFARMLYEGTFPFTGGALVPEESPRVGDGVLVLDTESMVRYASPNAVSSLHRMGIHANAQGQRLSDIGLDDDAVRTAFAARAPVTEELEWGDTSILLQVIPLLEEGTPNGALLLMRDVSELRRRDRMLLSKDATIREIHHRVKNNLQTVASLLRLQARVDGVDPRKALGDSVNRILAIAAVHEVLTEHREDTVDLAELLERLRATLVQGLVSGTKVTAALENVELEGQRATALALVFSELLGNALEHGGRQVAIRLVRREGSAVLSISDDGKGMAGAAEGTGLSIVRALVGDELGGSLTLVDDAGLRAEVVFPAGG